MEYQFIDYLTTPYKGLMPYSEEDAPFFFGREKFQKIITANLKGSRLTVLYGSAGVGKSSVLRAGVAYHLQKEAKQNLKDFGALEFAVVVFNSWRDDDPLDGLVRCVQESILQAMEPILDELTRWVQDHIKHQRFPILRKALLCYPHVEKVSLILWVFGFLPLTLTHILQAWAELLSREEVPLTLTQTLPAWAELLSGEGIRGKLFIILDQFEEYFLYHSDEEGEGTFFAEFPRAVNCSDVNFLISIREDSLAKLDRFKARIPSLFDNYLRLKHLDAKSAYEAIVRPIDKYNSNCKQGVIFALYLLIQRGLHRLALLLLQYLAKIEPDLAKVVIDQVSQVVGGGSGLGGLEKLRPQLEKQIETPFLQLVMTRLWEEEMNAGSGCLQLKTSLNLGGVEQIVRDHLNKEMESLNEDEMKAAANVFQYLITPSGNKIAYPVLDLVELTGLREKQLKDLLVKLSSGSRRILRSVGLSPSKPNIERYEIFHDVLAQPILDWRRRYVTRKHLEQEREEAKQLRIRLIKQGLAAQSLSQQRRRQDILAALLARQAYYFNQQDQLHVLNQVDDALRQALSAPYFSSILKHHTEAFSSIAFSPNGTKLAAGSWDGNIYLWNQEQSYSEFKPLAGHEEGINAIAFSPDGQWLASGSRDQTVRLWDLRQNHPVSKIIGKHQKDVTSVAFKPDNSLLASGSKDRTVKLWNWHQPEQPPIILAEHSSEEQMGMVRSLTFSPNASTLAVSCDDRSIWLWDVQKPAQTPDKEPLLFYGHGGKIRSLAFSPDGQLLASASDDYTIRLWDITQPEEMPPILADPIAKAKVRSVVFSFDGQMLASASDNQTIRLWKTDRLNEAPQILRGHTFNITSVAFSPDDRYLASCGWDNTVRRWDLNPPIAAPKILREHQKTVRAIAISSQYHQNHMLASGSDDKTVRVWDLNQPNAEPKTFECGGRVFGVALFVSSDRQIQLLAAGSDNKIIRLWDLQQSSDEPFRQFTGHQDGVSSVAFSPDGRWLASGSWKNDATIRLWDLDQPDPVPIIFKGDKGHTDSVISVKFSPDGTILASASDDKRVLLWNLKQPGADPIELKNHINRVWSIAFSPDGKYLASASNDWTVRLWNLQNLDLENPDPENLVHVVLKGHSAWVSSVAFTPDGKVLASGSFDRSIRLWQIEQIDWKLRKIKEYPIVLEDHNQSVTSVAFTPDGKYLASGSFDCSIRLWIASTDVLADMVCQKVLRNLTRQEWQQFMGDDIDYERTCPQLPPGDGTS